MSGILAVDRDAMTVTALRRHAAEGPQRRPRAARAVACTTWATSPSRPWPGRSRPAPTAPAASRPGWPPRSPGSSWSPAPARCSARPPSENPDVLDVARVGLGALGILTAVTFRGRAAVPARGARAADVVGRGAGRRFDEMVGRAATTSTCTGSRTPTGCSPSATTGSTPTSPRPSRSPAGAAWLDDDLLVQHRLRRRSPPAANRVPARRSRG